MVKLSNDVNFSMLKIIRAETFIQLSIFFFWNIFNLQFYRNINNRTDTLKSCAESSNFNVLQHLNNNGVDHHLFLYSQHTPAGIISISYSANDKNSLSLHLAAASVVLDVWWLINFTSLIINYEESSIEKYYHHHWPSSEIINENSSVLSKSFTIFLPYFKPFRRGF